MKPVKASKSWILNKNYTKTPVLIILFLFIAITGLFAAAPLCNPTAAQLCAAVDDNADIYLNGVFIDTFPYCNIEPGGLGCLPKCISLTVAQMGYLNDAYNIISVYTQNTNCCEVWASWSLDITCATGHAIVSSDSNPVKMYYDTTCVNPNPSPTPIALLPWYDPYYNDSSWGSPKDMTGIKFGKRIFDPATGNLLATLSYAPSMSSNCGALWFREQFNLTPVPTAAAPAFTISKTASPATNIGLSTPYAITFTVSVCNTGGGTRGNPLTLNDTWAGAIDNWGWQWPGDYTDNNLGSIKRTVTGKTAVITFSDGFPGGTCYEYKYSLYINSGVPTFCDSWVNTVTLQYLAQPVKVATAPITHYCPPAPNFTLVKSVNDNTYTARDQTKNFIMRLCNTGGAAWQGTLYIADDYTSAPGDWQFEGPYNQSDPAVGIIQWDQTEPATKQRLYKFIFKQPGFIGCYDLPMNLKTAYNYGCGPWHNDATLLSYMGLPTMVSTVNMLNLCSPTFTPTFTRTVTPTFTATKTNSPSGMSPTFTPTYTATLTFTRTMTPTSTITPQPTMDITKTANVGVAVFGDTITYTLSYHNTGSVAANPVCIYDTVPAALTYIDSSVVPASGAPNLSWCIGSVAPGGFGTIKWWGRISAYPFLPIYDWRREVLAGGVNNVAVLACEYREYPWHTGCLYTLKE